MNMRRLILIRHSQSHQDTTRPASQWGLSEEGRRRCAALAERLAAYEPRAIVASVEPKAAETGALVAGRLGLLFATAEGLHEHRREQVGFLPVEAFERAVLGLFERPDQLVMGEETGAEARERFERAVRDTIARHPDETVALVSHGTVMTLFVAHHAGVAPVPFWKRLGMPAIVVLRLPDFALLEVVERIEGQV